MKIKKYLIWKIILPVVAVSFFVSCEDFFNPETGGRISPEDHYKSMRDADASYVGCFTFLQEIAEKSVLVDGLRSDMMNITANADGDMFAISRHEFYPSNPYLDLSGYYKLIVNVNEVLPNLPQILELDRDFDSTILHLYEGALVTMRCWAYYNLARLNGEVGLVEGNLTDIDPKKPPVYMTKEQMYGQLLGELLFYEDPDDIFRYPIDHYALIGELYMELGLYNFAVKYLKYALDGPAYKNIFMVDDEFGEEDWELIFIHSQNVYGEVLTAVPYSYEDGQKNMLEEWMNEKFSYMVKPSDTLVRKYEADIAKNEDIGDQFRGMGITYDTTETGENYISKYSLFGGTPHSADVILYRAADIHLLLAEALNRVGQHDVALALLNDGLSNYPGGLPSGYPKWSQNGGVRSRAYLKSLEVPAEITDPTEYIEDLIIDERARELAFEGKRWFDLVRIAERRGDPAYLADRVAAKFDDPAVAEEVRTKLMDPSTWYIPLAKVE